jgi:hypothetical protein
MMTNPDAKKTEMQKTAKKRCKSSPGAPSTSQKSNLVFWKPEVAGFKKPPKNRQKITKNPQREPPYYKPRSLLN